MGVMRRLVPNLALILAAGSVLLSAWLFTRIQDERERSIRTSCQETNRRYDKAIERLDRLIAQAPADRKARAKQNRAGTVSLIDALVPKRDCDALVGRSVGPPK